jgi:cell wall-associated NlpC family hydrolase
MTAVDDTAIVKRWTRRLRIRQNLLEDAETALKRARTEADKAKARKRVQLRREQVAYAERVIARRETPKLDARERAVRAAMLGVKHRDSIAYTQGGARWDGIRRGCRAYKGSYPTSADCSSFVTWCLWDALGAKGPDIVNGAGWTQGYTGTQVAHGKRVPLDKIRRGDLVFYGGSGGIPGHVAIYVGDGKVVSHGSNPGPMVLATSYRPVTQVRRYLP